MKRATFFGIAALLASALAGPPASGGRGQHILGSGRAAIVTTSSVSGAGSFIQFFEQAVTEDNPRPPAPYACIEVRARSQANPQELLTDVGCGFVGAEAATLDVSLTAGSLRLQVPSEKVQGGTLSAEVTLTGYGDVTESAERETHAEYGQEGLKASTEPRQSIQRRAFTSGTVTSSQLGALNTTGKDGILLWTSEARVEVGEHAPRTMLASVSSAGTQGDKQSIIRQSISADGRFVAFASEASNLVLDDTNNSADVFVRDLAAGTTVLASVSSSGTQANHNSLFPTISADGRFVAFETSATNLVPDDTNGAHDVFVRDLAAGTTVRASVTSSGTQVDNGGNGPSISADGRYVAFESFASNLVPGDTNFELDVFVREMVAGTTVRASVSSAGTQANKGSLDPSISADGRFVAFESEASNLVLDDTNGLKDIFVRDLVAGTTVRMSVSSSGTQANGSSFGSSISADGRLVAFSSRASNLVLDDTNDGYDVFVRDLVAGATVRASVSSSGTQMGSGSGDPSISADGRFVTFWSYAQLVPDDTGNKSDVFVRDLAAGTTVRASVSSSGTQANEASFLPSISADGRYVVFTSRASNLILGDINGVDDVFVRGPL